MQLRALRYFAAVAEAGSFSVAAERLHRSQPALSRAIQELEADLGVQLFTRHGRRITLSPEGWSVLREAKVVLDGSDALADRARMLSTGKSAVLRIGGAASTVERVLPALIRSYGKGWPNVELSLTIDSGGRLLELLDKGELDVAFTRWTSSETLEARRLFPMHVVAVVPADDALASRRALGIGELLPRGLLTAPGNFTSRMLFDAACKAAELRPRRVLESADQNALVALAEVGYGVAIVPSTVALEHYRVRALPIVSAGRPLGAWTGLVWQRRRLPAHVTGFVDDASRALRRAYPGKSLRLPALARVAAEAPGSRLESPEPAGFADGF